MIYSINLLLCAISAFCFKNIFTFLLVLVLAFVIFNYVIKKMSNTTILLYFLNILVVLIGGLVIWLLPNREGIIPNIIINAYYLGPVEVVLFISFLISLVFDICYLSSKKNKKKQIAKKEINREKQIKDKEFKEKVNKLEKTINEGNEKIKKIVEKKTTPKKKKETKKKTVKHIVKKVEKK